MLMLKQDMVVKPEIEQIHETQSQAGSYSSLLFLGYSVLDAASLNVCAKREVVCNLDRIIYAAALTLK